ncbi:Hypothetical predicted protein [Podarcis lilfordi]|uniref:Uncharacterized protein n=1 Tax=Podarcis lilfordi TaxID=74358 RepID=A0AA35NVX8_9SAUR|nr:Hypothetical predicted protein [Podarcis lilfordi]
MRVVLPLSFVCLEWAFSAQDLAPPAGFCGVVGEAKAKDAEDRELRGRSKSRRALAHSGGGARLSAAFWQRKKPEILALRRRNRERNPRPPDGTGERQASSAEPTAQGGLRNPRALPGSPEASGSPPKLEMCRIQKTPAKLSLPASPAPNRTPCFPSPRCRKVSALRVGSSAYTKAAAATTSVLGSAANWFNREPERPLHRIYLLRGQPFVYKGSSGKKNR